MPSSQPLPPKEKTLFNRILKCYEQKQYKNGLKFAKQILSNPKFVDHGETLAMKGLTLNCTGKKEEAYELVKRGLKNDLTSHVCWHVYGLLQRSDKKYDEAIKCYRNALRWDKENLHILRDLSMLQVHMRDLEGYRETRYNLLQLKPGHRASWIGYAISNHLLKDYLVAYNVLDEFAKTQQSDEAQYDHSELLLYQAEILKEAGLHRQSMTHLDKHKSQILDKLGFLELKGELLILLGELNEAEEVYTNLLYRNPENHKYFEMLETILKPSNVDERLQIYQAISTVFPKSDSPKILPLSFATGSTFRSLLNSYMRVQLHRGVPPLFTTLKPLYKDPDRTRIIGEVVEGFLSSLNRHSKFSEEDSDTQPPTTLLWTKFFYAQHLDAIGKCSDALEVLNETLEHTPTLIELHAVKAKILKHLGDLPAAVACMDEAQSLDTADRFINCKCTCYMIRNDMIREADETAAKFTRENSSVEDYLREMQCMWYEVECARTHMKANRFGEALRKCHDVDKHFFEIAEDQFDFHQYCMRKMTLRSYFGMLDAEDSIKSHRFYYQAATVAIKVYLHLHDEPYRKGIAEDERDGLTKAEVKRLKMKQKRLEKKKAAAEEKKKQQENAAKKRQGNQKNQKQDEENETKKEDYLTPEALVSVSDPLEQASKFLVPLELLCSQVCDTHLLAFQVAERKGKLLVMLRAFLRARKTATSDDEPELHFCKVQFAKHFKEAKDVSPYVTGVINLHLDLVHNNEDPESLNRSFLSKHSDSLPHVFAAARAMYYLDQSKQEEAINLIVNANSDLKGTTWKVCEKILEGLRSKPTFGKVSPDLIAKYMDKCKTLFPRASVFWSASDREAKKTSNASSGENEGVVNGHDGYVKIPSPGGDVEPSLIATKDHLGKVGNLLKSENGLPDHACPTTV